MVRETQPANKLQALLEGLAYERAWRYCLSLCRRQDEAQDLLQDGLAIALLNIGRLRDPSRFEPWLLKILRNRFVDLRRKAKILDVMEPGTLLAEAAREVDEVDDPRLLAGLLSLPRRSREILELHYLHGLSIEDSAQVLSISSAAAKQLIYRSRNQLRILLSNKTPPTLAGESLGETGK